MTELPLRAFAGGIVLEGSPDMERGTELEVCDEFDLGARGALVVASGLEDWIQLVFGGGSQFSRICAMIPCREDSTGATMAVAGVKAATGDYAVALVDRGAAVPAVLALARVLTTPTFPGGSDPQISMVSYPYAMNETVLGTPYNSANQLLVNFGAREGNAIGSGPGLYRVTLDNIGGVATLALVPISSFDALGTGIRSEEFAGGTHGVQLHFRGIFKYGPLVCGFGQGTASGGSANGDNRLMFSNIARPLKWGRDDTAATGDRAYRDIDAVIIGAAGEIIRAGVEWRGRGWVGTNRELHWFSGYGVDSFVTDGTRSAFRQNVLGPHCLIEGPDTLLHGVGSQGHWVFDGAEFSLEGRRLLRFDGTSNGYWDLITATNQDLVWLMRDDAMQQVWIVIPRCNATLGYGDGTDTVILKYDVRSGGYTRQVHLNRGLTAGCYIPRDAGYPEVRAIADERDLIRQVKLYGRRPTPATLPIMTPGTPVWRVVRAPGGPEGKATVGWVHLTIGWAQAASLPLVFDLQMIVDDEALETVRLTIGATAPVAPATGAVWMDTSGTDTNLGVGCAGTLVGAHGDYVVKLWSGRGWLVMGGGQKGLRGTVSVPFTAAVGTRFALVCTQVTATGRYQIESVAFDGEALSKI